MSVISMPLRSWLLRPDLASRSAWRSLAMALRLSAPVGSPGIFDIRDLNEVFLLLPIEVETARALLDPENA